MEKQMALFGADVLPVNESSRMTRCPYDVASEKVADFAWKAALRYSGDEVLRAVLRGYVDCCVDFLQLAEHQRAFLRTEAWNRAEEALMLQRASGN